MLTLYTKDFCPYCERAKQYLRNGNIPFQEVNLADNEEARNFLKAQGHKTVPQIYQDGKLFVEGGCNGLMSLTFDVIRSMLS